MFHLVKQISAISLEAIHLSTFWGDYLLCNFGSLMALEKLLIFMLSNFFLLKGQAFFKASYSHV